MKLNFVLVALLILSLTYATSGFSQAQSQVEHSLGLQGVLWDHSTISVLVIPQEHMCWWVPSYLNATIRAIGEWNNAILDFASNYSNFSHLSEIRLVPTIAHASEFGFDVSITWTENPLSSSKDEIGVTQIVYDARYTITNCKISLAPKTMYEHVLNEVDMQNIALHELGHSLGLEHSNYAGDIMYPTYIPEKAVKPISTLDAYAVSKVLDLKSKPPQTYFHLQSSVTLPSSIPYRYLSISYENLPPPAPPQSPSQSPQTVFTRIEDLVYYTLDFIRNPVFSIALLIAISALIVTKILVSTNRKRKKPEDILVRTHSICAYCVAENDVESYFCQKCGKRLAKN